MTTTKQRIIDSATDQFAQKGFDGTTLSDIADAVNLRPPAIYRHFKNKEEIYKEVVDQLFAPFMDMVESLHDYHDEHVDVESFLAPIVARYIEKPTIAQVILQSTLEGGEQLRYLTENWFIPFFTKVASILPKDSPIAQPSAIINFHSLMLGYIGLAPFHSKIFNIEPLSEAQIAEHLTFLAMASETMRNIPN